MFYAWNGCVWLTIMAAMVVSSSAWAKEKEYKHPPVYVTCGVYGKLARCQAYNASDLVEMAFVYHTRPPYVTDGNVLDGRVDSGFIVIKNRECTPIVFYGTDPVNWGTYVVPVNVKLKDDVANFKECPQENVADRQ